MKTLVKKLLPNFLLSSYHYGLAVMADLVYGHPSGEMVIIGVTGTKGKTSTANFIWSVLSSAGLKTGQIGTASIRLGDREMLNDFHMTMPGPFKIQKFLRQMKTAGCTHVVMEATSEGMKLWRHIGIEFDVAVFTNLTPEHLPSHGTFENYRAEKTKLFRALSQKRKVLSGFRLEKISIINTDSDQAKFFLDFPADKKLTYGIDNPADLQARNIKETPTGVDFSVGTTNYHLSILGGFNVYNALPAIAVARAFGIKEWAIQTGLNDLKIIAGRMEAIDAGQAFTVLVDYAHEKVSMNAVLDTAWKMAQDHKVIVLLGAEGGGRDKSKRALMGEAAAKKADYVICSDVDPYDDDPYPIANDIAVAAEQFGKVRDQNLFVILNRREGIAKALSLASSGDIVLVTGKGAEQTMIVKGESIPWDDRLVVREELKKIINPK